MLDRSVLSQRTNEIPLPPYPEDEDGWSLGAEGDVTHHLLSFESVITNPNLILGDRFVPIPTPDNVQKASFEINGIPMECWHSAPAEEPQAIIGFLPGTKMPAWAYQTERDILHSMGFAITALTQTNPVSKTGFIPHHVDAAEAFIFDPESPLYTMGRSDIPRLIITHSANGPYAIKAALNTAEKGKGVRMPNMLHLSPCVAPAGASDIFHPLRSRMYEWHTSRVPDVVCGQHWRDKMILWPRGVDLPQAGILKNIFFWANGSRLQPDVLQTPTHGQAFEIMEFGSRLMADVYSNPYRLPWHYEDQHSISARNDFASCSQTGKVFGETIGIHHMVKKGDHSIIDKSEEARDVFTSVLESFMARSRQPVLVYSADTTAPAIQPQKQHKPLVLPAPAALPVAAIA